ncbi:hypothetical protein H257_14263 [Aphanomyces astaci]|uniref:Tyr recombinase domain-containing protein n=1 Tax=Aphanomyces astaci TaxID=112090 RepID=W4FRW1_APHAT|nr:hypothetical protein H257_14263 [Aphanomyces astaci]ETV70235.1 hypothetical protein H257_14263 [Aphanomyces astaci]|eukprot:XP_009840331.1 hypothetical protein H257_14263 [Aphanomyces astaci]
MVRLALVAGLIGCFRISEVLGLRWNDIQLVEDNKGRYLSVRLRCHKKANVEEDSLVYHLVDKTTSACLRIPRRLHLQVALSRGGSFYRVFESRERRFNFRELMTWCRWADAKTCCEYLLTQKLAKRVQAFASAAVPAPKVTKQLSMDNFVAQKAIPTARSDREAWLQWFVADSGNGLTCALKDYSKEMIQFDRKKYSERHTLAMAFIKYQSFDQFEASYTGFTNSYARILKELMALAPPTRKQV